MNPSCSIPAKVPVRLYRNRWIEEGHLMKITICLLFVVGSGCDSKGKDARVDARADIETADTAPADTAPADAAPADAAPADAAPADATPPDGTTPDATPPDGTTPDATPADADAGGCGSYTVPQFVARPEADQRRFQPSAIDPATALFPGKEHFVVYPRGIPLRPELFVMLGGSEGAPQQNTNIYRIAAQAGYRVIGLAYPNEPSGASLCDGAPDQNLCFVAEHEEKIYGIPGVDGIEVGEPESIVGRLKRLITHLATVFPQEGWEAYLDADDELVWANIVLTGFSQGSGHSGYLGKDHLLARLVFLSSGGDSLIGPDGLPTAADWCKAPRMTPAERTFGMLHVEDNLEGKALVYAAYGLPAFGDFSNAGENAPPHDCSHQLLTDLPPRRDPDHFHTSLANDDEMPVDADGIPVLAEDYFYLMVPAPGAQ